MTTIDFAYATTGFKGGALVVADLDGDGRPEVLASQRVGGTAVYRNAGGLRFEQRSDWGIAASIAATSAAAADLDNDGDRDLVLATANHAVLLANDGTGHFTTMRELEDTGTTEHVLAVDLDGNGLLDLYFSSYDLNGGRATRDRLYLQRSGFAFDVVELAADDLTWTAAAIDIDGDGDLDLHLANDTLVADHGEPPDRAPFWPPDRFLRNDGLDADGLPILTDIAADLGLTTPRSSMGGLLADFDGDASLDLFIPDFGPNKVFVRDPDSADNRLVDRAPALGVAAAARDTPPCASGVTSDECLLLSWSGVVSDFDNNGADDLLVINGATYPGDTPPAQLFTREGDTYVERSPRMPCMDARTGIASDLDLDGDQDLVIAPVNGPLAIYETRGRPRAGSWLSVTLRGSVSNRDGIGAIVTARLASGRTLVRAVGTSGLVHAAVSADAWLGLGADTVDELRVRWPSGRESILDGPLAGALVVDE